MSRICARLIVLRLFQIRPGLCIAGIEVQRFAEAAYRPIDVPHLEQGRPEILNRGDVTRLQSHGLGIVLHGRCRSSCAPASSPTRNAPAPDWASRCKMPVRCRTASAVFLPYQGNRQVILGVGQSRIESERFDEAPLGLGPMILDSLNRARP